MAGKSDQSRSKQQSQKALLGLRDLIVSGGVSPGERLSEVSLSEKLEVSRTPLRAALQKLELEGLVELIPTGGYAVRGFSAADIIDSIELRGVLEGTAARLAAERGVAPEKLHAMQEILDAIDGVISDGVENMNFDAYDELNQRFHEGLAEISGSEIIQREIARATGLPFASPNAFVDTQVDVPEFRASLILGQSQHKAIVEAIAAREGARAEALAREHARLARQNLDFVLKSATGLKEQLAALALMTV